MLFRIGKSSEQFSSFMAFNTFSRARWLTGRVLLTTWETVEIETPDF